MDSDGTPVVVLEQEEGVILGTVTIGPVRGEPRDVPRYGRYCKPMPFWSRVYQVFVSTAGRTSCGLSIQRRRKAEDIADRQG